MMSFISVFFSLAVSASCFAHEAHHEMKSAAPLPGKSIYQLDSQWLDKNSQKTKLSQLVGEPRLVVMLYTRCQTACPLIVAEIKSLLSKLPKGQAKKFPVAVFSLDSEKETPETLSDFAKKRKLGDNWRLFTGDKSAVAGLAAALGVRYKKLPDGEYIHSNVIYLLDKQGVIVAQKEGFKNSDKSFLKALQKINFHPSPKSGAVD